MGSGTQLLITNAYIVLGHRINGPMWVAISNEIIEDYGSGERTGGIDIRGRLLVPGYVDMHSHGAAGSNFGAADLHGARSAIEYHRLHGTTTMLAGIVSNALPAMEAAARSCEVLVRKEELAGIFYEGPYISPVRKGAHNPDHLRRPDKVEVRKLLDAGAGAVRLMTFAPELPGALGAIGEAVRAGTTVAVGHTDASYGETEAAFEAGARVATHLFNGMRPVHHRHPGPVVAALRDERIACELIADGYHLDDSIINFVFHSIGPGRVTLVTDSIEVTGLGDGVYDHNGRDVVVSNGKVMSPDRSFLSGSTLTMDRAVQRVVQHASVSVPAAIIAATATPARVLGLAGQVGRISRGLFADLNVLEQDLSISAVMRRGTWLRGPWI